MFVDRAAAIAWVCVNEPFGASNGDSHCDRIGVPVIVPGVVVVVVVAPGVVVVGVAGGVPTGVIVTVSVYAALPDSAWTRRRFASGGRFAKVSTSGFAVVDWFFTMKTPAPFL